MIKETVMYKLFGFIDRNAEASDFIDTGHPSMMNLPMLHIKDSSKYTTQSEEYKYL